ncbi:MAG: HAD hydrolase family protein [Pseudomonadota bacterium]
MGNNVPQKVLVLVDIDGTIIDSDGGLFPGAVGLFSPIPKIIFGLCSARPLISVMSIAQKLSNVTYLSALQGALIAKQQYDSVTPANETIHCSYLTIAELKEILSIASLLELDAWIYTEKHWYVKSITAAVKHESQLSGLNPIETAFFDGLKPVKVLLVSSQQNCFTRTEEALHKLSAFSINSVRSKSNYIELTSQHSSDFKGADIISKESGIDHRFIVAVGDEMNDKNMIDFAAYGYAFRKSPKALSEGNFILPNPEDGGLRLLREKLLMMT